MDAGCPFFAWTIKEKRAKKARKIGKGKKQGNLKKQGLEGQGMVLQSKCLEDSFVVKGREELPNPDNLLNLRLVGLYPALREATNGILSSHFSGVYP